jgi:membrane peptidoglycan carboxypeptidase
MAEAMGLRFDHRNSKSAKQIIKDRDGSFTLGPYATSPLDLVSAYSTLAANGTQCDPIPVTEILDHDGKPLTKDDGSAVVPKSTCKEKAIPKGVATTLNQMLRNDVEPGHSGQTASRAYVPGHQIAGKTGTSQNHYSIAFVGYTPEYAASVMVLNPKRNDEVQGYGGGQAAQIWHDAMEPILRGQKTSDFPKADPKVAEGNTKPVPFCGGVADCQARLAADGFKSEVSYVDSDRPQGYVVGTSPAEGSRGVRGQVVTILVSNGSGYVPPAPKPAPTTSAPPTRGNGGGGNGNGNGDGGHGGGGGNGGGDKPRGGGGGGNDTGGGGGAG